MNGRPLVCVCVVAGIVYAAVATQRGLAAEAKKVAAVKSAT